MDKVAVFVDGNDFYHGLIRNNENTSIDFYRFGKELCFTRKLIRVYYYNVPFNQNNDKIKYQDQQRFFAAINNTPYVTLKLGSSYQNANIQLIVDMINFGIRKMYDTAIIVSSDDSYIPAVEVVKDLGRNMEHAYFGDGADALRTASDSFTILDNTFLNECHSDDNI